MNRLLTAAGIVLIAGTSVMAAEGLRTFPSALPDTATHARLSGMWNLKALFLPPETWPVTPDLFTELKIPGGTLTPLFFEGPTFQGKSTRVFAWVAMPAGASRDNPFPGIVLVHGGQGTAYRDWAQTWMLRGYAAIAMDTEGNIPSPAGVTQKLRRHEWAGPPSHDSFMKSSEPVEDQGPLHAVSAVIRAHSLLRSYPGVDNERTGITGISWGGVWTELVIGLDTRFKFAAPVYACGFLGENSAWQQNDFQRLPPQKVARWLDLWDPSQYIAFGKMPVLFVNGTNDSHFRSDSWRKTTRILTGPVTRSLQVRMAHGHPPAGDPKEITAFANSIVRGGDPLPKITGRGRDQAHVWVSWENAKTAPVTKVELVYTTDAGLWQERRWETRQVAIRPSGRAEVDIPASAIAFYFNLHDSRGCIVSSEHWVEGEP